MDIKASIKEQGIEVVAATWKKGIKALKKKYRKGKTGFDMSKCMSDMKDEGIKSPGAFCNWLKRNASVEVEAAKLTEEAQDFVSKKIALLRGEGKTEEQAAAIAYSMAREKGYDVPEPPK